MLELLLLLAATAGGPAFEAKVTKSMTEQREGADEAFNHEWYGDVTDSIPASQARRFSLWLALGATIRICKTSATSGLIADWKVAADRIGWGYGPTADGVHAAVTKRASTFLDEPETDDPLTDLTAKEKAGICAVELEAARRLLKDL